MIEQDTIKLLRECDAGVKMGVASIEDVLDHVEKPDFRKKLMGCPIIIASLPAANRSCRA